MLLLSLCQEPEERPDILSTDEEPTSSSEDEDSPKRTKKSPKPRGRPPVRMGDSPEEVIADASSRCWNDTGVGNNSTEGNGGVRVRVSPPPQQQHLTAGNIFDFESLDQPKGGMLDDQDRLSAAAKKRGRPLGSKNRAKSSSRSGLFGFRTPEEKKALSFKVANRAKELPPGAPVKRSNEEAGGKWSLITPSPPDVLVANTAAGVRDNTGSTGTHSSIDGSRQQHSPSLSFALAKLGPKMNDLTRPPPPTTMTSAAVGSGLVVTSRRLSESSDSSSSSVLSSRDNSRGNSAERESSAAELLRQSCESPSEVTVCSPVAHEVTDDELEGGVELILEKKVRAESSSRILVSSSANHSTYGTFLTGYFRMLDKRVKCYSVSPSLSRLMSLKFNFLQSIPVPYRYLVFTGITVFPFSYHR